MSFLETTVTLNFSAPINQMGYGISGLNISKALTEAGHTVALFTISNIDVPETYHEMLRPLIIGKNAENIEDGLISMLPRLDSGINTTCLNLLVVAQK